MYGKIYILKVMFVTNESAKEYLRVILSVGFFFAGQAVGRIDFTSPCPRAARPADRPA